MLYREWKPSETLPRARRSVALGVFDGLHLGHRAVISAARDVAPAVCGELPVVTVLSLIGVPKSGGKMLTAAQEQAVACNLGVDEWLNVPFALLRDLSPEQFVYDILHGMLGAETVCCGYNFRFGKGGVGTADTLRSLCESLGIAVRVVPAVERGGTAISSTEIRAALEAGDPERAMRLLGRPYAVAFPVRAGNHLGTQFGYPTINQPFPKGYTCPRFGVYASLVIIDGVQYRAITNIGVHPTVGGSAVPQAETFIHDFEGDLYGKVVTVQLIRFLREERQFADTASLTKQITEDVAQSKAWLDGDNENRAILFDFDDTLQHRPQAFLKTANEMLLRYFPQISAEEREARAQIMLQENCDGYVDYIAYFDGLRARWDWGASTEDLYAEFRRRFPFYSTLFPDAVTVLRELRRRGYRLGIITNGDALQQNLKLDAAGVRPLVDVAAVGGEEGVDKPAAEVFRRVAQRLGVAPERCVYVGDYPPNDIVGAQNAGMTPLYIDVYGRGACGPEVMRVTSLTQLLDYFE